MTTSTHLRLGPKPPPPRQGYWARSASTGSTRAARRAGSQAATPATNTSPTQLFEFARLRRRLESLLGRSVDLVTRDALKPQLREQILREAPCVPPRDPNLRLQDIAEAIDRIFDYTASH